MKQACKLTILLFIISGYTQLSAQTSGTLIPKKGLFVTTDAINWIAGSEVNFFTPDKNHHHYYFTWWEQDVDSLVSDKTELLIGSQNTAVNGTYSLKNSDKNIVTKIDCQWMLKDSGIADIVYAKLWFPFLKNSKWNDATENFDIAKFTIFHDTLLIIKAAFGHFRISSSHPFRIMKKDFPNPSSKDYDKRTQFIYLYENDIPLSHDGGIIRKFEITQIFERSKVEAPVFSNTPEKNNLPVSRAWTPEITLSEILPMPKLLQLDEKNYKIPFNKSKTVNSSENKFRELLALKWQIGNNYYPKIISKKDLNLADEGYIIKVGIKNITILHKTERGLQHAIKTMAQLTRNINEELIIPQGTIKDEPSTSWRGIHMFTGPTSLALHKRMYDRILLPLKMNKVVLQCEQAEWTSQPFMRKGINISLKDLQADFEFLRKNYVEPIPLIQSLGHMEWLFKPKSNRKLAVNPSYPYTLNVELPQAREVVKKIWDETLNILKPNTIHIGFDEIGMIGFHLPREKEIELWKIQMKYMGDYAERQKVKLMLWGDMGLAPGEGPDALNGKTKERAAILRSTIPSGTYIADWHYINDKNPDVYKTNLRIWKENKNIPLASPWFHPDNIYGFVHAAIEEKSGVLQTTWADFESSEQNMIINIEQFGAYILALDYAWSGRKELPSQLLYHPVEEWNRRFYGQALPVTSLNGTPLNANMSILNNCNTSENSFPDWSGHMFNMKEFKGYKLDGIMETLLPEGAPVAWLRFYNNSQIVYEKQLRYGVEVRAENDNRPIFAQIPGKGVKTLYDFSDKIIQANQVKLESIHPCSGLRVKNIILLHD